VIIESVSAMWLRIRSELRSTWRTTILLVLIVAVGAGSALAAVAGARRTQTAMHRFVEYNQPEHASLFFAYDADRRPVLALPEIARVTHTPYLMMSPDSHTLGSIAVFGAADDNSWRTIDRPWVLRGRMPNPEAADEVVVDDGAARTDHLRIGSVITLYAYSRQQVEAISNAGFAGGQRPRGPQFRVRVVGFVRFPGDIAVVPVHQDVISASTSAIYATPAFMRRYAETLHWKVDELPGMEIARVQLRGGVRALPRFSDDVRQKGANKVQLLPGWQSYSSVAAVQRGADVEAIALMLFAVIALVVTLALVVLNVSRLVRDDSRDYNELVALGFTRAQLALVAFARPAFIALAGTLLAVIFAVLLSPFTPIGLARQAEIHRGLAINVAVLTAGATAVILLLLLCAAAVAWIMTGRARASSQLTPRRIRIRIGPAAVEATRGDPPLARRLAIIGVVIATAGVAAAATFGTSLSHLAQSPKQQGWNFDVVVGNANDQNDQRSRILPPLVHDAAIADVASIAAPPETPKIDGQNVGIAGFAEEKGAVTPVILEGEAPHAADEIAVGRASLRALDKRLGDRVDVVAGGQHVSMRVTGVMLNVSAGSTFDGKLDEGAAVTLTALQRLEPPREVAYVTMFFVRFAPSVDKAVEVAHLQQMFPREVLQRIPAQDVANLQRVDALPGLLATLLAVLALATMTHVLITSVRRRRHDYAVLKAIGFVRTQLGGVVMWRTWTLAAAGVALGIPLGIVGGETLWRFVTAQIGSTQRPVAPAGTLAIAVVAAAVIATLVALIPAWLAARTQIASALRSE
jgi:ABC-type lipoprotein release transport system permease subunit